MAFKNFIRWFKSNCKRLPITVLLCAVLTGCFSQYTPIDSNSELASKVDAYLGDWQGDITTGPEQTAPIILHFGKNHEGYEVSIDSPYQQAFGIPLILNANEAGDIRFTNSEVGILFDAQLLTQHIAGSLSVAGNEFDIDFTPQTEQQRNELSKLSRKSQTPKPPFDYEVREITIENENHQLAATLTLPNGQGPFPAVVLLSGTGPDDRDYSKYGHKRFWVLADYLTQQGIAVLRFDERGVGKSTGVFQGTNFAGFSSDINALVDRLKEEEGVDVNRIGLIGHSEGGMIASLVASQNKDIDFLVLLASMSDENIGLQMQYKEIAASYGFDKITFSAAVKALERQALKGAKAEELFGFYMREYQAMMPLDEGYLQQTAFHFASPSMLDFFSYKPAKYLSDFNKPVLSICGQLDHYFDCDIHTKKMQQIFEEAGNSEYTYMKYPQLNHYLQQARTGTIAEEANLEETISKKVLSDVSQWILGRL